MPMLADVTVADATLVVTGLGDTTVGLFHNGSLTPICDATIV
jgi:hypothetical protein